MLEVMGGVKPKHTELIALPAKRVHKIVAVGIGECVLGASAISKGIVEFGSQFRFSVLGLLHTG